MRFIHHECGGEIFTTRFLSFAVCLKCYMLSDQITWTDAADILDWSKNDPIEIILKPTKRIK